MSEKNKLKTIAGMSDKNSKEKLAQVANLISSHVKRGLKDTKHVKGEGAAKKHKPKVSFVEKLMQSRNQHIVK